MRTLQSPPALRVPVTNCLSDIPSMDRFRIKTIEAGKIGFFSRLIHPKKSSLMQKELDAMRQSGVKPDRSNPSLAYHELSKQCVNYSNYWMAEPHEKIAIRLKPGEAKYWNSMGIIKCLDIDQIQNLGSSSKQEMILDATCDFAKAIELDPKFADAHNNWGNALRMIKKYQYALEHYNAAIEIDPNTSAFYQNRAKVLIKLGRTDEAQLDIGAYERMSGCSFMPKERISGTAISPDNSIVKNFSVPVHTVITRPSD